MERLTTSKDVSEMNMVELAHNSCYVKDHNAMFRSYDSEIDARNLARKLIRDIAKCDDDGLSDNDYFDEWISDFLYEGTDSIEGLIAVFYRNLWAMAELRERLKDYEDIGLLPEQIKEVDGLYAEKCKELAESQKRCLYGLELPCKVGDKIYRIDIDDKIEDRKIEIYQINNIVIHSDGSVSLKYDAYDGFICELENIVTNKPYLDYYRCFLTEEEAEAALKKMEESE